MKKPRTKSFIDSQKDAQKGSQKDSQKGITSRRTIKNSSICLNDQKNKPKTKLS